MANKLDIDKDSIYKTDESGVVVYHKKARTKAKDGVFFEKGLTRNLYYASVCLGAVHNDKVIDNKEALKYMASCLGLISLDDLQDNLDEKTFKKLTKKLADKYDLKMN